jgi:PBP1b-binding outer membrane lipoprotein LpoB
MRREEQLMREYRILPCVLLAVMVIAGCSFGPSEEELALASMQEQAKAVRGSHEALNQQRTDMAAAKETLAELEAINTRQRTDEQNLQIEELTAKLPEMQLAIDEGYNELQDELTDFLNVALNSYPETPEALEGLRIYSMEAMLTAEETVQKSGAYKKAMDDLIVAKRYYEDLEFEPLPALVEKITEYEDWRFITKERFDLVEKGMTPDEVKEKVGVPYFRNIQENPDKTTTWKYPRREGGAAAIYFNKGKVYHTKFDAVKPVVAE